MKTIGLLGGMSWESSIVYEQIINQQVRARLGGVHSASLLIRSYDFAVIEHLQVTGDWEQAGRLLAGDAARLQAARAQILVLATNTMHQVYDQIAAVVSIAFPHIADPTAAAAKAAGLTRVGLLGTRFTMERGFYRDRLETAHDLSVLVPDEPGRAWRIGSSTTSWSNASSVMPAADDNDVLVQVRAAPVDYCAWLCAGWPPRWCHWADVGKFPMRGPPLASHPVGGRPCAASACGRACRRTALRLSSSRHEGRWAVHGRALAVNRATGGTLDHRADPW